MFKQFDSLNIETSLNSFRDIFSEYFSDDSKWEIRTLEDFYISVNKKDEGVIDSLFLYVKESKNIGYKVIDFEMIFEESYNLFGSNHRPNQRETIRAIVLEIKNKIEENERLINLNSNNNKLVPLNISDWLESEEKFVPFLTSYEWAKEKNEPYPISKDGKKLINSDSWSNYLKYREKQYEKYLEIISTQDIDKKENNKLNYPNFEEWLSLENKGIPFLSFDQYLNKQGWNRKKAQDFQKKAYRKMYSNYQRRQYDNYLEFLSSNYEKIKENSAQMIDSIVPKESMKVDNIQKSKNAFEKDKLPTFIPSLANHPEGFEDNNNNILNLKYALYNHSSSIQSFFNDLDLISISDNIFSINDDVLNLPPFDEAVYCQIVREMHRFSLAELRDKHEEQSNARSKFGLIAGGLLGILMRNPFAPFFGAQMGSNVGKSVGAKSNKIKEFLPDPNLLFFKDNYSYLSIGRSQTPKTRRIIFAPLKGENGNLYFRIIPAIVTLDYILPMQIFKIGINEYYLRPIGAGIDRHQKNYDATKIHRKYYHQRIGDGISKDTEERIKVVGPDIEDIHYKLYSYQSDSQDLNYLYFDYIKQPGHVY